VKRKLLALAATLIVGVATLVSPDVRRVERFYTDTALVVTPPWSTGKAATVVDNDEQHR
jgi:hypothetical protein